MLRSLKLNNVGPAPEMTLDLASRLNLITGDNGLGKSFLLDVAWWALTRNWAGHPARPSLETLRAKKKATIYFEYDGKERLRAFTSEFLPEDQAWKGGKGHPPNPGLVIYARVDGGFAVWDPVRNQKRKETAAFDADEGPGLPPAFVFTPEEVWNGLKRGTQIYCNGLISDLVSWQRENGASLEIFRQALRTMSETSDAAEALDLGRGFARMSVSDARDYPTIRTGDRPEVSVVLASAAVRRILGLVYLLVWAWNEHRQMSELKGVDPTTQVIFLIDEVECHLHPRWQRTVVPSLMKVVSAMAAKTKVQLVVATHSPLVLASVEPIFEATEDAWFDLDQRSTTREVVLEKRPFVRHGDVSNWLMSEAFDLGRARSLPAEDAMAQASALCLADAPAAEDVRRVDALLRAAVLPDTDPFLARWSLFARGFGVG